MKKITSTKTYATMVSNSNKNARQTPCGLVHAHDTLKYSRPVLKSGKVSTYIKILSCIGKTGSTWLNVLSELGVAKEKQYSSYFCIYRYSMLEYGLIKKAGREGRKVKYALTDLGDRYVSMALRRKA